MAEERSLESYMQRAAAGSTKIGGIPVLGMDMMRSLAREHEKAERGLKDKAYDGGKWFFGNIFMALSKYLIPLSSFGMGISSIVATSGYFPATTAFSVLSTLSAMTGGAMSTALISQAAPIIATAGGVLCVISALHSAYGYFRTEKDEEIRSRIAGSLGERFSEIMLGEGSYQERLDALKRMRDDLVNDKKIGADLTKLMQRWKENATDIADIAVRRAAAQSLT